MSRVDQTVSWKCEDPFMNRVVQGLSTALLEVCPPTSTDKQGVSSEGHALVIQDEGDTAWGVAGAGPGLQGEAPEADGVSILNVQISLGPTKAGDDRLAAGKEGPEQPGARNVVRMAVGVHSIQEPQSQLLDQLGIPMRRLQNRVYQNGLSGLSVTQEVSIGAALGLKQLP